MQPDVAPVITVLPSIDEAQNFTLIGKFCASLRFILFYGVHTRHEPASPPRKEADLVNSSMAPEVSEAGCQERRRIPTRNV